MVDKSSIEKIDFVILWVDDTDKKWLKKKQKWEKIYNIEQNQPERFRDWNNLYYQFRAIEKYAPWVNHIYLITDDQQPSWLKLNGNNVTIIYHKEIMEENQLPTFNSRSLELNLHRIPGLSEKFVYFNDDIFILDKLGPEDFFLNELPRHTAALNLIMPTKEATEAQIVYNNTSIINEEFNKHKTLRTNPFKWINYKNGIDNFRTLLLWIWPHFSGFKDYHLCGIYKKSTYEQVWRKYGKELKESSNSKFRDTQNYNQWLFRDWQLASNDFVPQNLRFGKAYQLADEESVEKCVNHIKFSKTKLVCVNDTELLKDFEEAKKKINSELEKKYPNRSKYEL